MGYWEATLGHHFGSSPQNPSNRLLHGDYNGFHEAMHLVVAECDYELRDARQFYGGSAEDEQLLESLLGFRKAAEKALELYGEIAVKVEYLNGGDADDEDQDILTEVARHMRAYGDANEQMIGEAIDRWLEGDESAYSELAI